MQTETAVATIPRPLSPDEVAVLKAAVELEGLKPFSERSHVSASSVTRACAGWKVRAGNVALIRAALADARPA